MAQDWCSGNTKLTKWPTVAPGNQHMVQEWCSGNTMNTKWPTICSGHSKCGPGVVFWEHEEHEVAY
eukprot:2281285-Pyramimonas_sp.AAC.1